MQIDKISNVYTNKLLNYNAQNTNTRLTFEGQRDSFKRQPRLERKDLEVHYRWREETEETKAKLEAFDILNRKISDSDLRAIIDNVDEINLPLIYALRNNEKIEPKTYARYIVTSDKAKEADADDLKKKVNKVYGGKGKSELNKIYNNALEKRRTMQVKAQIALIESAQKYTGVNYSDFPKLIRNTSGFNYGLVKGLLSDEILTTRAIANLAEKTRNSKKYAQSILDRYNDEKINDDKFSRAVDILKTNGMEADERYIADFKLKQINEQKQETEREKIMNLLGFSKVSAKNKASIQTFTDSIKEEDLPTYLARAKFYKAVENDHLFTEEGPFMVSEIKPFSVLRYHLDFINEDNVDRRIKAYEILKKRIPSDDILATITMITEINLPVLEKMVDTYPKLEYRDIVAIKNTAPEDVEAKLKIIPFIDEYQKKDTDPALKELPCSILAATTKNNVEYIKALLYYNPFEVSVLNTTKDYNYSEPFSKADYNAKAKMFRTLSDRYLNADLEPEYVRDMIERKIIDTRY